jgi:hypothetical protein
MMVSQSDIEHLQELLLRLSSEDAELFNRLEQSRLRLEFALAGIHRPHAIALASPSVSLAAAVPSRG